MAFEQGFGEYEETFKSEGMLNAVILGPVKLTIDKREFWTHVVASK